MTTTLVNELRALFGDERCAFAPEALIVYECDGHTLARQAPDAVVFPQTTAEVQATVRACVRHGVPFLARGAGTGLSGGAVAAHRGVIIETSRMRQIISLDHEDRVAVVQPGLVNLHLSQAAAPHGLFYAPDPSSQGACTIGGNVAENSGGPHTLKYGVTTNHVLALTVVLPDGELARLGSRNGDSAGLDLVGLFVGSEGTFGIATEITVRLLPAVEAVRTFLAVYDGVPAASESVSAILRAGIVPAALELIDNAAIRAVEAHLKVGFPVDAAAVLLIEIEGRADEQTLLAPQLIAICRGCGAREVREALDASQRAALWKGRKQALGALGKLAPAYYTHDGVVPRSKLPQALEAIAEIGDRHRLRVANVCHAGDGNLHPLLLFDPGDADEVARVKAAGVEILAVCVRLGGALTGEHGIGLEKQQLMPVAFAPHDLDQFERVRNVFDPSKLCNPGKLLPRGAHCGELHQTRTLRHGGWL
ncbi:MAG: FAD-linked oxidase C-terminal domain-containing protein [Acidobacteriota bacterium]